MKPAGEMKPEPYGLGFFITNNRGLVKGKCRPDYLLFLSRTAPPMAVGAYGGTPGRNALRPCGIWAGYRKIRMFFLPRIFESIRDRLHRFDFFNKPR